MTLGQRLFGLRVIVAAAILGGVVLCSVILLIGLTLEDGAQAPARATQEASWASLAPLKTQCAGGGGEPRAARYTPDAGPHRLVVFRSNIAGATDLSTFYNRTEEFPADWHAPLLEDAALVVCVQTSAAVIEECAYDLRGGAQGVLVRQRSIAIVHVIAAHSGDLVAQTELVGGDPRACQDQESFAADTTLLTVVGDPVAASTIAEWLRAYVD
jgi:hypothetical protein